MDKENQEERLKLENELLLTKSKAQMINLYLDELDKLNIAKKLQQEFINFLEDNWKKTQDVWYIKILNKYKEIIGVDK